MIAVTVVAATGRAAAQDHRYAAGWNVGGSYFTAMNAGGEATTDIALDPGWFAGLQFEKWVGGGRVGWRLNGGLTRRPLPMAGGNRVVGLWLASFDLMARMLPASPHRSFNLFVSAGPGAIQYLLGNDPFLASDETDASYPGGDAVRFTAAGGIGLDFITGWRWDGDPVGIRFEVADHVALSSPFEPVSGDDFSSVHNVRFVIGAFTGWGLLR